MFPPLVHIPRSIPFRYTRHTTYRNVPNVPTAKRPFPDNPPHPLQTGCCFIMQNKKRKKTTESNNKKKKT
ncbi:hypothetical protein GDO78_015162 [Eleutherodactylus coqui]|uniref:Uncharacterized protein n=1 Tax=Eleutherodactylus coqui TaxID=57060 RepID=A0A8J6ELX1_ELECQ|nr:hypothetical protein GDO78_015162 [Eleutherodactylus coqui]